MTEKVLVKCKPQW